MMSDSSWIACTITQSSIDLFVPPEVVCQREHRYPGYDRMPRGYP